MPTTPLEEPTALEGALLSVRFLLAAMRQRQNKKSFIRHVVDELEMVLDDEELHSKLKNDRAGDVRSLERRLKDRIGALASRHRIAPRDDIFEDNLEHLAKRLSLTSAQRSIFRAAAIINLDPFAHEICNGFQVHGRRSFRELVAAVTELPFVDVASTLDGDNNLTRCGLFEHSELHALDSSIAGRLQLPDDLINQLTIQGACANGLKIDALMPMPAAELGPTNYRHLQKEYRLIREIVRSALRAGSKGVNVLLFGPPGTGKTQLARAIIGDIGGHGFELKYGQSTAEQHGSTDVRRASDIGDARFRKFLLAQHASIPDGLQVMLVDESEEMFPRPSDFPMFSRGRSTPSYSSKGKLWRNEALEGNPIPTIWIANEVGGLHPAYMRRFTATIAVPSPPRSVRRQMLRVLEQDSHAADAKLLDSLAQDDSLNPADITRARRILDLCPPVDQQDWKDKIRLGLTHKESLHRRAVQGSLQSMPRLEYRPEWINSRPSVLELASTLRKSRQGRIALWGPPGTGKTAFAHHLADRLDLEILARHASDLLAPYVGETERLIADSFNEAAARGAILMLDECDSFLRNREGAHASWEVTQTNELLKQLEEFNGIVLLCTNHANALDPAVLRRLDLKIQMKPLPSRLHCDLLMAAAHALDISADDAPNLVGTKGCRAWADLTLGDVAAAIRQYSIQGESGGLAALLACVSAQVQARSAIRRSPIGF